MRPGDKVRLSSAFLRNTGQYYGEECFSEWTVQECDCALCKTGRFIATDTDYHDRPGELRHIAKSNLVKVGTWEPN